MFLSKLTRLLRPKSPKNYALEELQRIYMRLQQIIVTLPDEALLDVAGSYLTLSLLIGTKKIVGGLIGVGASSLVPMNMKGGSSNA